jgi:hypothetical protein
MLAVANGWGTPFGAQGSRLAVPLTVLGMAGDPLLGKAGGSCEAAGRAGKPRPLRCCSMQPGPYYMPDAPYGAIYGTYPCIVMLMHAASGTGGDHWHTRRVQLHGPTARL